MGTVLVVVVLLVAGVFGLFALVRWLSRSLHGHPEAPGRCARGGDQAGPAAATLVAVTPLPAAPSASAKPGRKIRTEL
ncbi:MAG: hypothetical protein IPQ09_25635 [Myxococcales bacterium]|nr:hypothetical protein [Myxococcales bacterium]